MLIKISFLVAAAVNLASHVTCMNYDVSAKQLQNKHQPQNHEFLTNGTAEKYVNVDSFGSCGLKPSEANTAFIACLYHSYVGSNPNPNLDANCGNFIIVTSKKGIRIRAKVFDKHTWKKEAVMLSEDALKALGVAESEDIKWEFEQHHNVFPKGYKGRIERYAPENGAINSCNSKPRTEYYGALAKKYVGNKPNPNFDQQCRKFVTAYCNGISIDFEVIDTHQSEDDRIMVCKAGMDKLQASHWQNIIWVWSVDEKPMIYEQEVMYHQKLDINDGEIIDGEF